MSRRSGRAVTDGGCAGSLSDTRVKDVAEEQHDRSITEESDLESLDPHVRARAEFIRELESRGASEQVMREMDDDQAAIEASEGANDLANNMSVVTKAVDATNHAASAMLKVSETFLTQAGTIENAVDAFLKKVAAA